MASELERRKLILHEYSKNKNVSIRLIAKNVKLPYSTVRNVIKNFDERLSIERKPGSGGGHGRRDLKSEKKIIEAFTEDPTISTRAVAKKVRKSQTFVQKVKQRNGLKCYKAQIYPDRNAKQNLSAKTRSRRLYEKQLTKYNCVIMDDETYCFANFRYIAGPEFYTAYSRNDAPDYCKQKIKTKFPKKYLVWQAICSCGKKSKPYFTTGTINGEVYRKECLKKRLLPFVRCHTSKPLFWPDLASCHYAKDTFEWYNKNNIDFVPKENNPPNCPELRPIEEYWSIIKGKLKKTGGTVQSLEEFKSKWNFAARKIDKNLVQKLMGRVRKKVRCFAYQ